MEEHICTSAEEIDGIKESEMSESVCSNCQTQDIEVCLLCSCCLC
jgi:hypothetical protein